MHKLPVAAQSLQRFGVVIELTGCTHFVHAVYHYIAAVEDMFVNQMLHLFGCAIAVYSRSHPAGSDPVFLQTLILIPHPAVVHIEQPRRIECGHGEIQHFRVVSIKIPRIVIGVFEQFRLSGKDIVLPELGSVASPLAMGLPQQSINIVAALENVIFYAQAGLFYAFAAAVALQYIIDTAAERAADQFNIPNDHRRFDHAAGTLQILQMLLEPLAPVGDTEALGSLVGTRFLTFPHNGVQSGFHLNNIHAVFPHLFSKRPHVFIGKARPVSLHIPPLIGEDRHAVEAAGFVYIHKVGPIHGVDFGHPGQAHRKGLFAGCFGGEFEAPDRHRYRSVEFVFGTHGKGGSSVFGQFFVKFKVDGAQIFTVQ